MIGIIVCGHGTFASGLTQAVRLIAGMPEKYIAVDYLQEDSADDLEYKLKEALKELKGCGEGILMFTDVVDKVPCRVCRQLAEKYTGEYRIEIISGTNLGMLVEANMARGFMRDLNTLASLAVETGKAQVMWASSADTNEAPPYVPEEID